MGRHFGIAAIDLVLRGDFGKMVCLKNGKISACPLENIYGKLSLVDVSTQYDADRYNGCRTILGKQ
jgi:6-phosphofructokinase 1